VGNAAEQRLADGRKAVMEYVQQGDLARAKLLNETLGLGIDIDKFNSGEKTAKQGAKVSWYSGAKGIGIADRTAKATEKLATGSGRGGSGDDGGGTPDSSGITDRIKEIEDAVRRQGASS
jgi:hypothetical protein